VDGFTLSTIDRDVSIGNDLNFEVLVAQVPMRARLNFSRPLASCKEHSVHQLICGDFA